MSTLRPVTDNEQPGAVRLHNLKKSIQQQIQPFYLGKAACKTQRRDGMVGPGPEDVLLHFFFKVRQHDRVMDGVNGGAQF